MVVTFPPEMEKKMLTAAAQKGLALDAYLLSLVYKDCDEQVMFELPGDNSDYDPEAGNRAVAALMNRTPEQIKAAQERAVREFKLIRELPPAPAACASRMMKTDS